MAQVTVDDIIRGLDSFDQKLPALTAEIASLAKTRLSASSTTTFMKQTAATRGGRLGRNPLTGKGTLRIHSGDLARSLTGTGAISDISFSKGLFSYIFGSELHYASVHEEGFNQNVSVRQHVRTITQAFGRDIAPTNVTVSAHSKAMSIPARPYLSPALDDQMDFLTKEINRRIFNLMLQL